MYSVSVNSRCACSMSASEAWPLLGMERARPKSATFMRQSELSSRLDGLMSRCTRLAECMNLSAFSVCHMMYCLWTSPRMLARIAACCTRTHTW